MTQSYKGGQDEAQVRNERSERPETGLEDVKSRHDAAAFLAAIIKSSDDAIISKSLSGIILTWNKAAERVFGYTADEAIGEPVTILIPEDRLEEEPIILRKIHDGHQVDHFETIRRRKDGSLVDLSLTISPIRDSSGRIIGASKIARDISERRRASEHQDMLLREMHHRVKNLFTITGSLITLAARTTETSAELANSMKGRLLALSRAHEMTLPSFTGDDAFRERSTTLFQLFDGILAPYSSDARPRYHLHGTDFTIGANKVTNLALLFHEFATNAAKYGCLSVAEGQLDITVSNHSEMLEVIWSERSNNPLPGGEGKSSGFGTKLEGMIARGFNGSITREWLPTGLSIRIEIPHRTLQS